MAVNPKNNRTNFEIFIAECYISGYKENLRQKYFKRRKR